MHRVWPPFSKSKEYKARRSTSVVLSGRAGGGTFSSLPLSPASCSSSTCNVEPLSASLQYKTRGRAKRPSCGKGEFQWASGLSYTGEFKGDKREGYGRLTWPDGSSYEGYFRNDLREGMGVHKWEDTGEVYEGCYHNDKRHGQGIYRWPSGASFTGTFKEDLKSGPGTYISPHGERYEGVYNNDVRDGEGVLSYPGGRQDIGIWKGTRLTQLKFVIKEVALDPKISRHSSLKASRGLYTPDLESRGKAGPKGYLEVASQEFIQEAALGNLKKVKAILDTGAVYVDVVDGKGNSALFAAAMNGKSDVVNYLLDNGADVNRVNHRGMSILNACHHAFFCHHPRVRVLLDQLHLLLHSTATTGSGTLSSRSDISDTETLFTSDFASTPRTSITGDSARRRGSRFIFDSEFVLEAPLNTLTRCRSMIELDQLGSGSLLPQHGLLGRVRSFPTLRPGGDKHVRFISRADEEEESSLESLNELSNCYHNGGISSQATEGPAASGTSLHESGPLADESSLYNSGTLLDAIGTSEMYVPYDELCGGKQFQSMSSFRGSTGSIVNQNQTSCQQDSNKSGLKESNGGSGPSKRRPQNLSFTSSPPAGNFANVPEGSVTASAAGEVMGVSALNSETSQDCLPEGEPKHLFSKKLMWTRQGKRTSFSPGSHTPTDVEGSQVSLPNISQQTGSMVQFNGYLTPPTSVGTPSSVHTRPSTGYAHQLPNSNAKSLPVLRHSSLKKPNHHHHHPNRLLTFPDELHGSSVFSSTRYGSIVSAAQSMTLSSYAGSEVDMIESSASPSTVSLAQEPARCRSVDVSHVIGLLLSRGANPNVSSIPLNPMFYTILGGEVGVVKKLLESGAKTDQHLPDELGGYTLLHIAMANIGPFSPHIIELLLQYGADPNSGGRSIDRRVIPNESDEDGDSSDEEEEEEEEEVEEERHMGDDKKERLIPGKNEGSTKVTPLHMLCSVHIDKEENKAELFELVPALIQILIKYGADVNAVANGHSPLALAILHGHDTAIDVLLKNGANPDLPLGKDVGNAICALTTHPAHKCRVILSTTPHSLPLLHRLIVEGANVFTKVKLAKGGVGTILDFAHIAFQEDRRLSGLRYDHLTKRERARYRLAKRIITYLRSIFRCMALHNLAAKMNLLDILDMKIRVDRSNNDARNIDLQRLLATTSHDKTGFQSFSKGGLSSSELMKNVKPHVIWLPEMTISLSLTLLSKTINQETASNKDVYIEERVTASLIKKKGRLSRFVRYKELIEMAGRILKFYKMDSGMKSWSFSSFCYECGKSFGVYLTECCGCQIVSYCSKNCKTENWRKGHKDECPKLDLKSPSKCSSSSSRESTSKRGKGPKMKSKPGM